MYYFAYGLNMNLEFMRRVCGWHFTVIGAGVLENYEFGSDTRGYVNIRSCLGQKVFGLIYEVDDKCLKSLDEFEGYPEVFGRKAVGVRGMGGKNYRVWVYLEGSENFGKNEIREEYLKRVLVGARENRLPEEWINFLRGYCRDKYYPSV